MKFICEKETLLKELLFAQNIIAIKHNNSILANVYLQVYDNMLSIKATDTHHYFQSIVPVEETQAGAVSVFCNKVIEILRTITQNSVLFTLNDNQQLIITPLSDNENISIKFQLRVMNSDVFPTVPQKNDEKAFDYLQKDFIDMIRKTIFAVSHDENRYFMSGIYITQSEDSFIMVATDGKRLSFIKKTIEVNIPEFESIIAPIKALNLISRTSNSEGTMNISITDKNIFFDINHQKIISGLIDGQFPNYERVIPTSYAHTVEVHKKDLINLLRTVSILIVEKTKRISFIFSKQQLTITSNETEIGNATGSIPCDYDDAEFTIVLNCQFVQDVLGVIDDEMVLIKFNSPNKAIGLYGLNDTESTHIIMPMQ